MKIEPLLKLITEHEAAGKTVRQIHNQDWMERVIIVFTDDTYMNIEASTEYGGTYIKIKDEPPTTVESDADIDAGLFSQAQYDLQQAQELAAWDARNAAVERAQYEKLKAKYGA
jgi:hypothetical protein